MIETLLHFIQTNLLPLGALGVFLASLIEEVIAPIPSPIIILFAGVTFLKGSFSLALIGNLFWYVVIPASIGVTVGSLFVYYLVYYLGKPFIDKWGKWLGLSWSDIEKIEKKYESGKIDEILIFTLRAIPIVPSVAIAGFAGLTRVPIKTYVIFSVLGTVIRTIILGLLGWFAGSFYEEYATEIGKYENIILYTIVAIFIAFIIYRIYKKKKSSVV